MKSQLQIDDLPPYGFISKSYAADALLIPKTMQSEEEFNAFAMELATEISEHVWPIFDRHAWQWIGAARSGAVALTHADLQLCTNLARYMQLPIVSKNAKANPKKHGQIFLEEDCFTVDPSRNINSPFYIWGASFPDYASSTPASLCNDLAVEFDGVGIEESGGLEHAIKIMMQRPRPYQAAMFLNQVNYQHHRALSSQTPSLVSGHALQSAISGSFIFRKFEKQLSSVTGLLDDWEQFVVDVGDRRVFAGVHYPSDSIASWFCALRFVGKFYGRPTRDFLWRAISLRSHVYEEVVRHVRKNLTSPYRPILQWLQEAATANLADGND